MNATFHGYSAAQALRSGGRETVREALLDVRKRSLALADAYAVAAAASGRGMSIQYAPELNPPLWELGHTGWFQEYWIGRNHQRAIGNRCDPDHPRAASLLAQADACYDSGRVEHRSRWSLPLPDAKTARAYLAATLAQTLSLLDALPPDAGHDALYFFRLVALHEAMHAEAAVYMAKALGIAVNESRPAARWESADSVLQVPAQSVRLGSASTGFAFDNELGAHDVQLEAFEIDAEPVNWTRFLAYATGTGVPLKPQWLAAAAHDPLAAAVHLSAEEAQTWCRWAGRRLPTEAQWECAALSQPAFRWGQVWEWTASTFQPYPGFERHPYRDYSAPWFGTHQVLRGACEATSPWLAHPKYRNFFEPQRSDIFAGFRSCA